MANRKTQNLHMLVPFPCLCAGGNDHMMRCEIARLAVFFGFVAVDGHTL